MLNKKIFLGSSFLLIIIATTTFAMGIGTKGSEMEYKMIPSHPEFGDNVKIEISSFMTDLDTSKNEFLVDGEVKASSIGLKEFNLTIPNNNAKTINIGFLSESFGGDISTISFKIKPSSLRLIYEIVNPYKPSFYKGKSTVMAGSEVKVFAFPNFRDEENKKISDKNLIYYWKINDRYIKDQSGMGKTSLHIDKTYAYPRKTKVEVNVKSLDGLINSNKILYLNSEMGKVDFYLNDKTMPFNFKSVAKPNLISDSLDTDIIAVPYFFNGLNDAKIKWQINGVNIRLVPGLDKFRMNMIRNKTNFYKEIPIKFSLENENRSLQKVNAETIFRSSDALLSQHKDIDTSNNGESNNQYIKDNNNQKEGWLFGL